MSNSSSVKDVHSNSRPSVAHDRPCRFNLADSHLSIVTCDTEPRIHEQLAEFPAYYMQ